MHACARRVVCLCAPVSLTGRAALCAWGERAVTRAACKQFGALHPRPRGVLVCNSGCVRVIASHDAPFTRTCHLQDHHVCRWQVDHMTFASLDSKTHWGWASGVRRGSGAPPPAAVLCVCTVTGTPCDA